MNILKKYKSKLKRMGAWVLATAVMVGGIPSFGGIETRAATILEDNTVQNKGYENSSVSYGSSLDTAYIYGESNSSSNGANDTINTPGYKSGKGQHTFNFSIKNGTSNPGYNLEDDYKVNYGSNYFQTRYMFAPPSDVSGLKTMSPLISYSNGKPSNVEFTIPSQGVYLYNNSSPYKTNGQVSVIDIPGTQGGNPPKLEVRQTIMPTKDNQYLLVEYTVHNPNNQRVDFTIGNQTDTSLIGHDNCPIVITKQDDEKGNNFEGVHYHATKGRDHVMSTFDIYTDMKPNTYGLGIDRRDENDKSRIGAWAGTWSRTVYGGKGFKTDYFTFSKLTGIGDSILMENGDSAVAFSAYFDLKAHETKTARFAISAREHVYYANGDLTQGLGTGYLGSPVKKDGIKSSIENTIKKTETDNGGKNKNIYIMMQKDEEIESTIKIPDGYVVTILSADYGAPKTPKTKEPAYSSTGGGQDTTYSIGNDAPALMSNTIALKRKEGFKEPLFLVENGGELRFTNITIDGQNHIATNPLIQVEKGGSLIINTGTKITQGNTSQTPDKASAIGIADGAKVFMKAGDITKNLSNKDKGGAVVLASDTSKLYLSGKVSINENENDKNGNNNSVNKNNANVLLKGKKVKVEHPNANNNDEINIGQGGQIEVDGRLETDSKIGIGIVSDIIPEKNNDGYPVVIKKGTGEFSASSFFADESANSVSLGIVGHKDSSIVDTMNPNSESEKLKLKDQALDKIYIESQFYTISVQVIDESESSISASGGAWDSTIPNPIPVDELTKLVQVPVGKTIDWAYPEVLTNKKGFKELRVVGVSATDITGSSYKTIDFNTSFTDTSGKARKKIFGTMPAANLTVTVKFTTPNVVYILDPAGGILPAGVSTEVKEPVNTSATISTLGALPIPSKGGYIFKHWKEYTDNNHNNIFDNGDIDGAVVQGTNYPLPHAEAKKYYRAVWEQDTTSYSVQKIYKNLNPTLPLHFGSETGRGFILNADITEESPVIPGYKFSLGSGSPTGENTNFSLLPTGAGKFQKNNMPAANHELTYRYTVDAAQTFQFVVKHMSGSATTPGIALKTVSTQAKKAEQAISAQKGNFPGYTFREASITQGANNELSHWKLGLNRTQGLLSTEDYASTGNISGYMPNQDVEVVFYYDSDSASAITRRFLAEGNPVHADRIPFAPLSVFGPLSIPEHPSVYGYKYDANRANAFSHTPATPVITPDASGSISGTMPAVGSINVSYDLGKDASKWNQLHFDFVTGSSAFGHMAPTAPLYILTDDGVTPGHENAPNMANIQAMLGFPVVTADHYHMVDGWYYDAAGTRKIGENDRLPTNTSGSQTIYVKLIEDPSKWIDVRFESADNTKGSLVSLGSNLPGGNPQHLHYDVTWQDVVKPGTTPIANFELKNWTNPSGSIVNPTERMVPGIYKANFGKVEAVWGLNPGAFGATGNIGGDGSGTIQVTGTTPGNVYVITDPEGNIVGVATATGDSLDFPGMIPGRNYQVIEGTPDTLATLGQPASSITGSALSTPKPVMIPAIGENKSVGVDPENPDMAQIVIQPADPDADYALIDAQGNVVPFPDAVDGWKTPMGNAPASVIFPNLNPGETYTVVARKKGNPLETPLGNLEGGVPVVANPGSMVEAQNYIIETKTNGVGANVSVVMVSGESVHAPRFDQAKANADFRIHADAMDGAGNPFLYWKVLNGRIPGVTGKILEADYTGQIARSNVIFKAVYDVPHKNSMGEKIAPVEEGNRGSAAEGEFGLDPEQLDILENLLTNPLDQSLININHADVRYQVIFHKRNTKAIESHLIKEEPSMVWARYPEAFTTAWSLDIKEERYVDGRLVQNASPSNAAVKVSVQLEGQDTDMLDYEVWDMGPHVDGNWQAQDPVHISQLTFTEDVANNAGYLSFEGNLNHTYVLVYAKTFTLYFIDNYPTLDHRYLGDTNRNFFKKIKVRKKDVVTSVEYASDYGFVTGYAEGGMANGLESPFDDIYGVTHTYENWSKKEMPARISVFDPEMEILRTWKIFAYYNHNRVEVTKAREDLTNLIPVAMDLRSNPFLKTDDIEELDAAIAEAQNILDRMRGRLEDGMDPLRMANYPELQAAIDALQRVIDRMYGRIHDRNNRYISRTGGSSGGGSGSGGRGGGGNSGTPLEGTNYKYLPLSSSKQNTFTLGADGQWMINPMTKRWAFSLNGGLPLNNKWARIEYIDSTGMKITDWYRFDTQSSMAIGWYYDTEYKGWYYLNPTEGKDIGKMVRGWHKDPDTHKWYYLSKEFGSMATGWHKDPDDGRWYYLDPSSGEMATGWRQIHQKWYFFTPANSAPTWKLVDGKWVYDNNNIRPYGSMYAGETTPDGYRVTGDGDWAR